jgi:UDP-N-acetylmuramate: L-alanyl-gamma-D-glutamyl-meso-diaminopimelate ligase
MLPLEMGWFPEKITNDIDAVILGMHAKIIQNSSKRKN